MKQNILISLALALSLPAMADLNYNGYYRVENYGTERWISIVDNKGSIDYVATSGDFHSIALTKDLSNMVYDAASVLYIENINGNNYDITSQGTGVYQIISHYLTLRQNGTTPSGEKIYMAYGTYSGVTRYLADTEYFGNEGVLGISANATNDNTKWLIYPISSTGDNYFGAKPSVEVGGKYYTTLYASFPFGKAASSSGMKFYRINRVDHGQAEMIEISGNIPSATGVIIECPGASPSDNRIDVGVSASAISGNSLKGVYFSLNQYGYSNYTAYNPNTMRVLGKCSDGSLGFIKDSSLTKIPANTAYITVPEGSPDEFKCVSTEEFDAYVPPITELYVVGNFNNWATPDAASTYTTLAKTGDDVYSGTFTYSGEGTLEFKVFTAKTSDYSKAYGSSTSGAVTLEPDVWTTWNMTLGTSSSNFTVSNWGGGSGTMTVDLKNNTLTLKTDKVYVPELYMIGNFNDWHTPDANSDYFTLTKTGDNVYSGTINYSAEGSLEFKVFNRKSNNYDYAYGSSSASEVTLEPGVYSSWSMTLGTSSSNFNIVNWGGSTGTVTVDLNSNTLSVITDKVYIPAPTELYMVGNFNNWETPGASSSYLVLNKVEDNIYSGTLNYDVDGLLEFKVFDELTDDWSHAYGAAESSEEWLEAGVPYTWENIRLGNNAPNFTVGNWGGKTGTVTVNIEDLTLTIVSDNVLAYTKYLSLVGSMNTYNVADKTYTLTKINDEGDYEGEFNIASPVVEGTGTIQFKLVENYKWDVNYGATEDEYSFVMYDDSVIDRELVLNANNWRITNWAGGMLKVKVNLANLSMTLEAPDQPSENDEPIEPQDPDVLYLIGDMQGWDIFSDSLMLDQTAEDSGIYVGTFNIAAADDIFFRFYTKLGDFENNSLGSRLGYDNVEVLFDFDNDYYYGTFVENGMGCWYLTAWGGGTITMTVDMNDGTVAFYSPGAGVETIISQSTLNIVNGVITVKDAEFITITDMSGRTVARVAGETIDINNMPKGIYVISASNMKPVKIAR